MPELPEVEFGRRLVERVAVGRTITQVRCARDDIVFVDSPMRVRRAMKNRTVIAAHRHGKYIWWELDSRPWPIFHFGMTGSFRAPDGAILRLESSPRKLSEAWPPPFCKIRIMFDDGNEIVMTNARRLGRIRLGEDPLHEPPLNRLGFDPLNDMPSLAEFTQRLEKRSGIIKGVLLDQGFAAGVGNWIADEVLYQAGIAPHRSAPTLSEDEIKRLRSKILHVVKTAVRANADKNRFPKSWLFHHRWGKNAEAVTRRGEQIEHVEIAGRTTAWVPEVQQ